MSFDLKGELLAVASALGAEGIEYALCGGLAVAVHGFPRATRDLDLLVREADLERILSTVEKLGFTLSAGLIPFDVGKETERQVYRISKAAGEDLLTLDLMLATPFLEDIWASRQSVQIGEQQVQVVSLEGLKKMKRVAARPQDLADLAQLEEDDQP